MELDSASVLGVRRDASEAEIRAAYRRMRRPWTPVLQKVVSPRSQATAAERELATRADAQPNFQPGSGQAPDPPCLHELEGRN